MRYSRSCLLPRSILAMSVFWPASGLAVSAPDAPLPPIEGLPFEIGRLDSTPVAAGYPRLFFSPDEVGEAKARVEKDPASKAILDRLIAEADKQLEIEIKPLDESWWDADKDKPWEQTYPQVFQHTMVEPAQYGSAAANLATVWLLTGEERYYDKAEELLRNLSAYQFRAEHYDVGMNYTIWSFQALKAYDAMLPEMSTADREAFDGCMTRLAHAVAGNDVFWIKNNIGGGLNNHLSWHKMMLGLLGLFYERPEMVEYCLHGERGLVSLLEEGLLDDGQWCESSLVYHFTGIVPMALFADAQRRAGLEPTLFEGTYANGRTLKQPFDTMFNVLAPDGMIPPIGDAYGLRSKLWDNPIYEYAWAAWGDLKHAWLLARAKQRSVQALFSPALPADPPAPPIASLLLPEHGYAFLRSHQDEAYWGTDAWMAFLTYDRSNVHANADKLSLMLFGQQRMLLSDVEGKATVPHAFSSQIQRELNRGGLSQNTVMIDGQDQRCMPRQLRLVEYRDLPDEKRVTAVDDSNILYDGVRQMRTICMTPDYVLDVFQVDCGQTERQIDWIVHVMDETATAAAEHNLALDRMKPFELPKTGAWPWLRDARSLEVDSIEAAFQGGPIAFDWRADSARVRLLMLDPGVERVIACGYPATDKPGSGDVPMLLVRRRGTTATFAALWLIGERPEKATLTTLPPKADQLVYEVRADGRPRRHLVPALYTPELKPD